MLCRKLVAPQRHVIRAVVGRDEIGLDRLRRRGFQSPCHEVNGFAHDVAASVEPSGDHSVVLRCAEAIRVGRVVKATSISSQL